MPASFAPSLNVSALQESATIAVSDRARALIAQGRPVIDLGAGEPDFPTPSFVAAAARHAIESGATRYTAVEGILPLREAIAARARDHGADVQSAEVVVSTGSKQALFNACFVLFGAGDEVLVPTPAWTSYYEMLTLARARAVPVYGSRVNALKVTAGDLAAAATSATRGVMLNSPTNPTGAVYSVAELRAILDLADQRGWWVVADEIYRRIAYDAPAASLLDAARGRSRARIVVVDGVAKAFAMTGWRIGWSIAPMEVARAMRALQSHTTSNATTVAQHATLAALTCRELSDDAVTGMVNELRRRRDAAMALLREGGVDVIEPRGAFYLFMHVASATTADPEPGTRFARHLLEVRDVALVPGAAFRAPEWVRLAYAAPVDRVLEGVRRLVAELRHERSNRD